VTRGGGWADCPRCGEMTAQANLYTAGRLGRRRSRWSRMQGPSGEVGARGPMDKAPASGAGDWRFEFVRARTVCGVEEHRPHKPEIAGSNPAPAPHGTDLRVGRRGSYPRPRGVRVPPVPFHRAVAQPA